MKITSLKTVDKGIYLCSKYQTVKMHVWGSLNKFPDFFVWVLLLIVQTWDSSHLQSNLLRLQYTCCTVTTTSGRLHGSPLSSPQFSHSDSLWAWWITKSHKEQGLYYREAEKLSWYPSWSNSLWQGWSCGLVHCPGGNATDSIWRVLASSNGISSWTPLKPQHSNPLANQLWCIDFFTPPTPLIIPHRLHAFLESLMPLKNWCSIHARCSKSSLKHSIRFCGIFFSKFKTEFYCIFEIHQLWQSGFSRVYSNCCCSCSFEPEIIKIGQSSHKMYSNNILNFQESTTILNAYIILKKEKSLETYWMHHIFMRIFIHLNMFYSHTELNICSSLENTR